MLSRTPWKEELLERRRRDRTTKPPDANTTPQSSPARDTFPSAGLSSASVCRQGGTHSGTVPTGRGSRGDSREGTAGNRGAGLVLEKVGYGSARNSLADTRAPSTFTTGALRSHAPLPYQPLSADSPPRVCHTRDAWRLINTNIFPAEKRKSHMQRKRPSKIRKQVLERVWKETEEQRAPPKMVLLGSRGGESKILSGTPMLPIVTRDKNERASLLFFCDRLHVRPPDTLSESLPNATSAADSSLSVSSGVSHTRCTYTDKHNNKTQTLSILPGYSLSLK